MHGPFATVTPGRHPFEIGALVAGVVIGVSGIVGARSTSVERFTPSWAVLVYYAILAFWSLIGLVALAVDDQVTRMKLERLALYPVGYCCLGYGIAAVTETGLTGVTAGVGVAWISFAAAWRIRQIHIDLRLIHQQQKEVDHDREGDEP